MKLSSEELMSNCSDAPPCAKVYSRNVYHLNQITKRV